MTALKNETAKFMKQTLSLTTVVMLLGAAASAVSLTTDAANAGDLQPFWLSAPPASTSAPDTHTALRGTFELKESGEVELRVLGATWFNLWVDGEYLADGPARFPRSHPESDTLHLKLAAGKHVLAAQVHYEGVDTRVMLALPPFFACDVSQRGQPVKIVWRAQPLTGYRSATRRRSPLLGWMEWCDTRPIPANWQALELDDAKWLPVIPMDVGLGPIKPLTTASVASRTLAFAPIASGPLACYYGPDTDDPPVAFFLADLECQRVKAQGEWRRYDLGKQRIARPRFVLDLPAGAVVEFGSSEELLHGRVAPWSGLSGSPQCFVDHFIARGGRQEFFPLHAQGARFFEVHVYAPGGKINFLREEFIERAYYGEPVGEFHCGDARLEKIWHTGLETSRSASEDAVVDSRRERGQWTGDLFVGQQILATAYSDLRLARRGIVQAAWCAQPNGLMAALCPGSPDYITGYAAMWVGGVLHHWELTGDRSLLEEMFPFAEKNFAALASRLGPDGVTNGLAWNFVDWGYIPNDGEVEVVFNLQFLEATRSMERWCQALGRDATRYQQIDVQQTAAMRRYFDREMAAGGAVWERIGYQRTVFGLRLGIISGDSVQPAVAAIKDYIRNCFPSNPAGEPLANPDVQGKFFTPYFANFALPELAERGEMDFVLEQYRRCWGWALDQGLTTWPEVFDLRWSHSHQWSGSPTWVMSRYLLGLYPRFDLGTNHFECRVVPGNLKQASGKLPLPDGNNIEVSWVRNQRGTLDYTINSSVPLQLHMDRSSAQPVSVLGRQTFEIKPFVTPHTLSQ